MADYQPPLQKLPVFNSNTFLSQPPISTQKTKDNPEDDPKITYNRLYQDLTYSFNDGYYALAKDVKPMLNNQSAGVVPFSAFTNNTSPVSVRRGVWSPEKSQFVFVGNSNCATSPDGKTWTSNTIALVGWRDIAWSPKLGVYCACNNDSLNKNIGYSSDAINWSSATTPDIDLYTIIWADGLDLFIAGGYKTASTARIMTSSNATTWTAISITGISQINSIAWSPELKLVIALSTNSGSSTKGIYSRDGVNWSSLITNISQTEQLEQIAWSPTLGMFVAVLNTTGLIFKSTDGFDWTNTGFVVSTGNTSNNRWIKELGLFVIVSSTGTNTIAVFDGYGFYKEYNPSATITGITWSPELGSIAFGTASTNIVNTALKGRPTTSNNVFNYLRSNYVNENGLWSMTLPEVKSILKASSSTPSFQISPNPVNTTNKLMYLENNGGGAYNNVITSGSNSLIFMDSNMGSTRNTIGCYGTNAPAITIGASKTNPTIHLLTEVLVFDWTTAINGYTFKTSLITSLMALTGANTWTGSSDARLKKDITDVDKNVYGLRPVEYRFNNEEETTPKRAGLIAQETETYLPMVVDKSQEYYGIKYTELIPYLIKTIQELSAEIVALELLLPQ